MAQQALNFAQRKNSTLNFLTENDFLQEEKIVAVKNMQKRRRFEQAEQSNTPPGPENLPKSLDFVVPYWLIITTGLCFNFLTENYFL